MGPALSHVVFYVGGASASSSAAVDEVNRFCATLPGGFGIRVIHVRFESDRAALDRRVLASNVIEHAPLHPARLTRRPRAERIERRIELTDVLAAGAAS